MKTGPSLHLGLPLAVGAIFLAAWEGLVRVLAVPVFVLPPPSRIVVSLVTDFPLLADSLAFTLAITAGAFLCAVLLGVGLAVVFAHSRLVELALMPYAVVLQVTPVVAIAPLVIIWTGFDHAPVALFILATIVAFFPVLSAMLLGLRSVDHGLRNLFELYGAPRWRVFVSLELPSALPHLLGGMKIAGGLALIGAVVAEFVAGSGTATGLAWRIVESGNRLDMPRMFAALLLLSVAGVAIHLALRALEHRLLRRWHESAVHREN
jgi:NitT/TauT family transport system permease protein